MAKKSKKQGKKIAKKSALKKGKGFSKNGIKLGRPKGSTSR